MIVGLAPLIYLFDAGFSRGVQGVIDELFRSPRHPYTRALMDALPGKPRAEGGERRPLAGEIPDPRHPPSGCRFHTRCPLAAADAELRARCTTAEPAATRVGPDHVAFCHRAA